MKQENDKMKGHGQDKSKPMPMSDKTKPTANKSHDKMQDKMQDKNDKKWSK